MSNISRAEVKQHLGERRPHNQTCRRIGDVGLVQRAVCVCKFYAYAKCDYTLPGHSRANSRHCEPLGRSIRSNPKNSPRRHPRTGTISDHRRPSDTRLPYSEKPANFFKARGGIVEKIPRTSGRPSSARSAPTNCKFWQTIFASNPRDAEVIATTMSRLPAN